MCVCVCDVCTVSNVYVCLCPGNDLNLLHAWSLEAQVEAIVGQRADFLVVPVIAHADDGDLGGLYQRNHFLQMETHDKIKKMTSGRVMPMSS